jgi:nitrogen fixation/metabolism regulation signal transduction histidine kinase
VRAFSEFASEPEVHPEDLDINAVVTERVALLRPANQGVTYHLRLDDGRPRAHAASDLVNGILTNLLQNAAEAAGPGGTVLVQTRGGRDEVTIESIPDRVWRRGIRHVVRADDYLQEARDGARSLDCQKNALL